MRRGRNRVFVASGRGDGGVDPSLPIYNPKLERAAKPLMNNVYVRDIGSFTTHSARGRGEGDGDTRAHVPTKPTYVVRGNKLYRPDAHVNSVSTSRGRGRGGGSGDGDHQSVLESGITPNFAHIRVQRYKESIAVPQKVPEQPEHIDNRIDLNDLLRENAATKSKDQAQQQPQLECQEEDDDDDKRTD